MAKSVIPPACALFPVPVVLVSCLDRARKRTNAITIAWCGNVCSEPPCVSISIRPSRHSYDLIKKEREFAVNIPSAGMLKEVDTCGIVSGRDFDKFASSRFTAIPASKISASLIGECPVNIECKLMRTLKLGSHDIFIGRVVAMHADGGVLDPAGRIDPSAAGAIAFCQHQYWSLGKKIGDYGFSRT